MWIKNFSIYNYKCFNNVNDIELSRGINLIIGQNNSGKSALLNAISMKFQGAPYLPNKNNLSKNSEKHSSSLVNLMIGTDKAELISIVSKDTDIFGFNMPESFDGSYHEFSEMSKDIFERDDIFYEVKAKARSGREAELNGGRGLLVNMEYSEKDVIDYNLFRARSFIVKIDDSQTGIESMELKQGSIRDSENNIGDKFLQRVYAFQAERIAVSKFAMGIESLLRKDASNLAEVLHNLQSSNTRFRDYIKEVNKILPNIKDISVRNIDDKHVEIKVTSFNVEDNDRDLYFSISECGTGVGQVLAMVYLIMFQKLGSVIIIDEPNSFLHPGATRKLIELMKKNNRHQYIISSHSPEVLTYSNPEKIFLVKWSESGSFIDVCDAKEVREIRDVMSEVGFRISDVFGADKICWVEGPTEERCFPIIAENILQMEPSEVKFLAVRNTSDFDDNKHRVIALHTYEKLIKGDIITPPAVRFIFDLEGYDSEEVEKLGKESKGKMALLPRRCYENFLLDSSAISGYLSDLMKDDSVYIHEGQVIDIFSSTSEKREYFKRREISKYGEQGWLENVDAPKVLKKVFADLTNSKHAFNKIPHSVNITKWIVQNNPAILAPLSDFLQEQVRENSAMSS